MTRTGPARAASRAECALASLFPALVAVGTGLAALPAGALELGDVNVQSALGQPLRASIAFALAPNESLAGTCIAVQPAAGSDGIPPVGRASVSVVDGLISVAGEMPVREPLMSLRLAVRCPYTPQLMRDYLLFFDPVLPAPVSASRSEPAAQPAPAPAAVPARTAESPRPSRARNAEPITGTDRYRVQPGDSLSLIAQRIPNRPIGLWEAAGAIFDANPDAFVNDDPNRLKAGAWLVIPDFAEAAEAGAQAIFTAEPDMTTAPQAGTPAEPAPVVTLQPVAAEPAAVPADTVPAETAGVADAAPAEVADPAARPDLRPGDVMSPAGNPSYVGGNGEAAREAPRAETPASVRPSRPAPAAAADRAAAAEAPSRGWLWWLAGAGLAVAAVLLALSSAVRNRFGSTPVAPAEMPQRRRTDSNARQPEPVTAAAVAAVDMDFGDDSPTGENLALDADLFAGTGLSEGSDADIGQDFGFAKTTALDMELPEEMSSGFYEVPETDIIPPLNIDPDSILESEVLPDEDDDYDMSVVIDATQMPQPEDVTERDLEALELDTVEEHQLEKDYTLSQEVDFEILEQDYEDELTATQALNLEIARAAAELAETLDEDLSGDDTSSMSMASVTALDVTAQLPANDDDEASRTGELTASLTAVDKTVELPGADGDKTAEMPVRKSRAK